MSNKLYVGSLPYETTDEELKELFSQAGQVVSVNIIVDKFSGRSKGFGFVEMSNDKEAAQAITMFHNYQMGDRTIIVNEARPMEDRKPRSSGGYGGGRRGF